MDFSSIHKLVQQGASERVLQAALKSDLSLLGRALAHHAIPDVSGCPKPHINGEYPMGKEMEAA
jgi:hypothetical protein